MSFVERKLHQRELNRQLASLPPILAMETLLFRMIVIAFSPADGGAGKRTDVFRRIFGKAVPIDHKTLFAFAAWGIFAALLIGRHVYGWRGRIALRWTLTGFLVLLLAYIGSRFVSEVLLGRI